VHIKLAYERATIQQSNNTAVNYKEKAIYIYTTQHSHILWESFLQLKCHSTALVTLGRHTTMLVVGSIGCQYFLACQLCYCLPCEHMISKNSSFLCYIVYHLHYCINLHDSRPRFDYNSHCFSCIHSLWSVIIDEFNYIIYSHFLKLHSTLGIKFSKTGFLQLVDSGSQPLTCDVMYCG